jgi:hypothetical protein
MPSGPSVDTERESYSVSLSGFLRFLCASVEQRNWFLSMSFRRVSAHHGCVVAAGDQLPAGSNLAGARHTRKLKQQQFQTTETRSKVIVIRPQHDQKPVPPS